MPAAGLDLRFGAACPRAPGDHGSGSSGYREGSQGAGSLHGRTAAHDHHRLLRHQRYRAGHRFPAAPLPRRVLRARPRQDPLFRQAAVLGPRDSLSRLLAGLRVRPEGHPVLPRRPPSQDAGDHPAQVHRHECRGNPGQLLRIRHLPRYQEGRPGIRTGPRASARRSSALRFRRPCRQGYCPQRQAHHRQAHPRPRRCRHQAHRRARRLRGRSYHRS
ncbi:hypothetical protein SDC9_177032 [bioreactor metagenome]|uniref:Uncharacterized protein n=1 Tax=bioreactor metagenome TaxID=1076179 RepID=A0A645GUZ7_9ZZZZ